MPGSKYKIVRKCPVCGEEFFARTLESWYCSPKCSKVAWKRKHDEEKRQLELYVQIHGLRCAHTLPFICTYFAIYMHILCDGIISVFCGQCGYLKD